MTHYHYYQGRLSFQCCLIPFISFISFPSGSTSERHAVHRAMAEGILDERGEGMRDVVLTIIPPTDLVVGRRVTIGAEVSEMVENIPEYELKSAQRLYRIMN